LLVEVLFLGHQNAVVALLLIVEQILSTLFLELKTPRVKVLALVATHLASVVSFTFNARFLSVPCNDFKAPVLILTLGDVLVSCSVYLHNIVITSIISVDN
jgi:hypothetical protein